MSDQTNTPTSTQNKTETAMLVAAFDVQVPKRTKMNNMEGDGVIPNFVCWIDGEVNYADSHLEFCRLHDLTVPSGFDVTQPNFMWRATDVTMYNPREFLAEGRAGQELAGAVFAEAGLSARHRLQRPEVEAVLRTDEYEYHVVLVAMRVEFDAAFPAEGICYQVEELLEDKIVGSDFDSEQEAFYRPMSVEVYTAEGLFEAGQGDPHSLAARALAAQRRRSA